MPATQTQQPMTPQEELALLQLQKARREQFQHEEGERQGAMARLQGRRIIEEKARQENEAQENCGHHKPAPDHGPSIGGQRDHAGKYHWVCLYCQKYWYHDELPLSLRIPLDRVGGPLPPGSIIT